MLSTTGIHIQPDTTTALRSNAFAYVQTDIPAGLTIAEYRRQRRSSCDDGASGLRRLLRVGARRRGGDSRYPDDPVGNPETTDGGW